MIQQLFDEQDLPMEDLQKIGLVEKGRINLDGDDLKALLSGRRTNMLRLENLSSENFHIPAIDAKLSLKPGPDGELKLMLHPIYRQARHPTYMTDAQAETLVKDRAVNLEKMIFDDEGKLTDVFVEFDKDTNEFIVTDCEKVLAPDKVNNEPLTPGQKERYRKGKEVELSDGTKFQHSATEPQGIRSNRLALIASIIVDGGVSYILYKSLNALFGQKQEKSPEVNNSKGFNTAKNEMEIQEQKRGLGIDQLPKGEYRHYYSRSGTSR